MGELKKTFLAGFAVLIILLIAPYYLEWIGYNDAQVAGLKNPEDNKGSFVDPVEPTMPEPQAIQKPGPKNSQNIKEESVVVHTSLYTAVISNTGGGSLKYYKLNNYFGAWDKGVYVDSMGVTLLSSDESGCAPCVGSNNKVFDLPFECSAPGGWKNNKEFYLSENESIDIVCSFVDGLGDQYTKTTTLNEGSFVFNHEVLKDNGTINTGIYLTWDSGINNTEKNLYDENSYSGVSVSYNEEIETSSFIPGTLKDQLEPLEYSGDINWIAIRNKYFIAAIIPEKKAVVNNVKIGGSTRQLKESAFSPLYYTTLSSVGAMQVKSYLGPLDIDNINALNTTLDRIMNFGWFVVQPFSRGILWLLKILHSFGLNYGFILILFAFLVRFVTGPLTKKSFESTQKMQAIQPKIKKIQDKYKSDPQKLNTEMVALYRDNNVNPVGGCLPMLLQMPLLFSLFLVFRSTIEFRGAHFFGWIKDLSLPDTIFNLPFTIPIYGDQVAFLPILLGISMFLTQKMSMTNMQGSANQQKYMMYFMSAFFFLIFNSFPSGLNLYYLIYNILNYLQQKSLKKV
tara:strand:- start:285 stop:1985 length:1701 start_codon:yes stop_codon:yes gene_type:complete